MQLRPAGPAAPVVAGAAISLVVAVGAGLLGSCGPDGKPRPAARPSVPAAPPEPSPAGTQAPVVAPGYSPFKAVIHDTFPDPAMIKVGATYYAYGTNDPGATLPVATAPSATGPWKRQEGDALPVLPGWATRGRTWAPEVVPPREEGGRYLLYFTARRKDRDKQCIGVATGTSPAGPFTPVEGDPLVCPLNLGGAIDPASFVEDDGTRYLLYKTDARKTAAIWLVKLSRDGLYPAGPPRRILARDKSEPVLVEAPDMVKRGGKYVLLYSAGWYFRDNYQTRYATAPSIGGPYTRGGEVQSTARYGKKIIGPGSADVVTDEYGDHLVFHGIVRSHGGSSVVRSMYVAALGWNGSRPVLHGVPVRYEAERARLNGCTSVAKRPRASGGRALARFARGDCRVELDVVAPAAGRYRARVGFANRSGRPARQELTVNGAAPVPVELRGTGGDDWASQDVTVELNAGKNTLGLRSLGGAGQIDYIELS
ncbi:family 43 glycosylhydrolase [Spirillospora sp. CA-253888]